jgi:hypothetical protein
MPSRTASFLAAACIATVTTALAQTQTLVISDADCRALVAHVARNDVNYKPGVDVHGRPVKPADLESSSTIKLPDEISIDISVEIYTFLRQTAPRGLEKSAASLGAVTFKQGRVYFNGQPIDNGANGPIAEACRAKLKASKP